MSRVWNLTEIEKVFNQCGLDNFSSFAAKLFKLGTNKRTTGKKSQNNHFQGHLRQWSQYRGFGRSEATWVVMMEATHRGYPTHKIRLTTGEIVDCPIDPKTATTSQFAILIDTLHQLAHQDEVNLIES